MSMRTRWARLGPAVVVAALILAACGSSDVQYVKNQKAGVYLKVPKAWGVFPLAEGHPMELGSKPVTNGASVVADKPTPWLVGFDGAQQPTREDFDADVPAEPIGIVEVVPMDYITNFNPSVQALKDLMTGKSTSSTGIDTSPAREVEGYEQVELSSGHWGIKLTFTEDKGSAQIKFLKVAFVDRTAERLYMLTILCSTTCFDRNHDAIEEVAASLTLEKR
jgi:hypothetical protein